MDAKPFLAPLCLAPAKHRPPDAFRHSAQTDVQSSRWHLVWLRWNPDSWQNTQNDGPQIHETWNNQAPKHLDVKYSCMTTSDYSNIHPTPQGLHHHFTVPDPFPSPQPQWLETPTFGCDESSCYSRSPIARHPNPPWPTPKPCQKASADSVARSAVRHRFGGFRPTVLERTDLLSQPECKTWIYQSNVELQK